jgi:DNA invertase Pin-like site-specific DNA recombinase
MRQFGVAIVGNVCYNQDTLEGGGKMRGVIYARYSSDNQREESIEGQIRENTAYAERNGITIVGHYIDRAYSAKTDNRPEFQRMIKDSARRGFDVIIVWKLDRFARNRYDSARYKMLLKKNDVRVISATEAISQGAEGIILEAVLEEMAEYYSADLSEKVSRCMKENALKCVNNGGIVTLGFKIDDIKSILKLLLSLWRFLQGMIMATEWLTLLTT